MSLMVSRDLARRPNGKGVYAKRESTIHQLDGIKRYEHHTMFEVVLD